MQTPSTPESGAAGASIAAAPAPSAAPAVTPTTASGAPAASAGTLPPAPDKSRFKFQKLLQPFTVERGFATPIIWFLLDWLVLGAAIATLLFADPCGSKYSRRWWRRCGSRGFS